MNPIMKPPYILKFPQTCICTIANGELKGSPMTCSERELGEISELGKCRNIGLKILGMVRKQFRMGCLGWSTNTFTFEDFISTAD